MTARPRVALSAGGDKKELAPLGLGMEHVEELLVRMARRLLAEGHLLAFGGTLNKPDEALTELLIDAALGWMHEQKAHDVDPLEPATWPLANDSAWPYHTKLDDEFVARQVGVCHFRRYDPPGVDPSTLPTVDKVLALEPPAACFTADALTVMRKAQATLSGLRVVLAGKIRGDVGWMPGILEEVDATLEAGKPVLVLGGLGGCAGLIAGFLGGGEWPEAFSVDEALKAPAFARMFAHRSNEVSLRARYQDVKTRLEALREAKKGEPIHGVPHHLFVRALTETSPREVLRLVSDVAAKVA